MKKTRSRQQTFDYLQKIIIIGDSGVGKSNILLRYSEGRFEDNYMMTIGINYMFKIVTVDNIKIKMQIWDTAGQDKYKTITQNYYRNSDGVLIVFSIDSRDSFHSVRNWIQDLTEAVKDYTQVIIVGNKVDLEQQRQVTKEQALQFSNNHHIPYIQCSAKSGESIENIFNTLAHMMKNNILDPQLRTSELETTKTVKIMTMGNRMKNKCCP